MEVQEIEKQLAEINQKLAYITEQMELQARRQREKDELRQDLGRIANDVFQTAVVELDEVAHHFDSADLLHLVKKLLRNVRNLTRMFDQMESFSDFMRDATPIAREAFFDLLYTLDQLDQKGYFEFFKEATKIVDEIVSSFSIEDVRALSENIVTILLTVKNLTQPDMLMAINNAISVYKNLDINIEGEISYWRLIKEARTPEMRRGIAFGIQFLKNLSAPEILRRQNGNGHNGEKE